MSLMSATPAAPSPYLTAVITIAIDRAQNLAGAAVVGEGFSDQGICTS
jgi:hypothetical protein